MRGRAAVAVGLVAAALVAAVPPLAAGHAGLVESDPAAGAELGAGPDSVRLTFSEQPEASLSEIQVVDADGVPRQEGAPQVVAGDPAALSVAVPKLGRGVYTVEYRVVSAVDGHATTGSYGFGVRVAPSGGAVGASTSSSPDASPFEVLARWALLLGLVALVGGAVAGAARFGGLTGTDLLLAACGWAAAIAGLVMLAVAQVRTGESSIGELLGTPPGKALIWRAVALVLAGAALGLAHRVPRVRRAALAGAAVAAIAAIAVHVDAGHAAAGAWSARLGVTLQVTHFAAAGVWFGGLAALLLGIRGEPSAEKAAAVARFAVVAAGAALLVFATGTLRAVDELSSWGELTSTGYGRAVLAKLVLIALIIGLAARNRRRAGAAAEDLDPLRRTSRWELGLAVVAIGVAALLGTLAPPVAGQPVASPGLSASGADFGATVSVRLTTASAEPGPNRFVVDVDDYGSDQPADVDRVSLRFEPLDDPGIAQTTLRLAPTPSGSFAASGANLSFDGRWSVTAQIQRGADAIEVPLELDLPIPAGYMSTVRLPDSPPEYTLQTNTGFIRVVPDPELAGPSRVHVTVYTTFEGRVAVSSIVVTGAPAGEPAEQKPVERISHSRFVADVDFEPGPYRLVVVARTADGTRIRGPFDLQIPAG